MRLLIGRFVRRFSVAFVGLVFLLVPQVAAGQEEPQLTVEQQKEFLLKAKVIRGRTASKGVTAPRRLTLSDGTLTHDAAFQSHDEQKSIMRFADGRTEMNFVDSYRYNIAAYELSTLLGLADMMPVTVARTFEGKKGALSWWLPVVMDELQREAKKIKPPDANDWGQQMHKLRVFSQLVYDTDRNLGNVLIDKNWKIYMIDFTRGFRLYKELENPKNLERCSRDLLEKLRKLEVAQVTERCGDYLSKMEINAVMARRDRIVALFEKRVAQKGEAAVLY